jgi:hypothetical protein
LAVQGVKQQKFNTRDILQRNKIVPKMASKMPVSCFAQKNSSSEKPVKYLVGQSECSEIAFTK